MTSSPKSTASSSRCGASFAGRSATREEVCDGVYNRLQLLIRDSREERERECLSCDCLRDRKRAGRVPEVRERRGEVWRLGVVALGADASHGQKGTERFRIARSNLVHVPDMLCAGDPLGQAEVADPAQ